jgi:hypothetical protein
VQEFQNYFELLEDSMVRLMMAVDGVDSDRLAKVLARVACAIRETSSTEDYELAVPESDKSSIPPFIEAGLPAAISKRP